MSDGYEQEDFDLVQTINLPNQSSMSAEEIYRKLGCESLEK